VLDEKDILELLDEFEVWLPRQNSGPFWVIFI